MKLSLANWLESPFEDDEVFEVVKALNGDKSPSPDGCFLACWEVLKADIMNVFHDFHTRDMIEKSFNATFISSRALAADTQRFSLNLGN